MPVSAPPVVIAAQTGAAVRLFAGDVLRIVALEAEQVADVALFNASNPRDGFSPGRTIDYNERIDVTTGDTLYSQRSTPLAIIVEDTVRVHDVLLAPCSRKMFERRGEFEHPSCHENLATNLERFGIAADDVNATVNVFMNVRVAADRTIALDAPPSRAGDAFAIRALCELIVGISACSSELTNNGTCKPVAYAVQRS